MDYLNPLRHVLRVFSKERTPRQLALGAAIGLMIGLVPKGNLIAMVLAMLLLALKVNLGVGLITAFGVTCIGPSVDRLSHGIGVRAFQTPWFYDAMRQAYQLPLVPWTSLNNTVVVGSLMLGLLLFYPTYHFGESAATALQPVWRRWRRRSKAAEVACAAGTSPIAPSNDVPSNDGNPPSETGSADLDATDKGELALDDYANSEQFLPNTERRDALDSVGALEVPAVADVHVQAWSAQVDRTEEDNRRVQDVIDRLRGVQTTPAAPPAPMPTAINSSATHATANRASHRSELPTTHSTDELSAFVLPNATSSPVKVTDLAADATKSDRWDESQPTPRPTLSESLARVAAVGESLLASAPQQRPAKVDAAFEKGRSDVPTSEAAATTESLPQAALQRTPMGNEPVELMDEAAQPLVAYAPHPAHDVDSTPETHPDGISDANRAIQPTVLAGEQRTIVPYSQLLAAKQRVSSPRDPVAQFLDLLNAAASPGNKTNSDNYASDPSSQ